MKKNWTKIVFLILLVISLFCLAGCSDNGREDFDVSLLSEAPDGFYVLSPDGNCRYLLKPEITALNGEILRRSENGAEAVFLLSEEETEEIPVVSSKDRLIVKSSQELENTFAFFPLREIGYTVGMVLKPADSADGYIISPENGSVAPHSSAQSELIGQAESVYNLRILSIGGQALSENLLSPEGTLTGLTKDSTYSIEALEGTVKYNASVQADTCVLASVPKTILNFDKQEYTDQGYVILELGDEVETGYYYIDALANNSNSGGIVYIDHN